MKLYKRPHYIFLLIFVLVRLNFCSADELTDFFNETFIRKQTGAILPNTHAYASDGFDNAWDFYHFHHVCVIKGGKGLFTGMEGIDNSWIKPSTPLSDRVDLVSEADWNAKTSIGDLKQDLMENYKVSRLDVQNQQISKLTVLSGSVFYFTCETPPLTYHLRSTDFISRLGILYEIGIYFLKNIGSETFKFPWPRPFQHVLMNRCPDPQGSPWNVAGTFLEIVKRKMDESNVTQDGFTNFFREGINEKSEEFICIEDMYLSGRMNVLMNRQENHISFRRETQKVIGEPASIASTPESKFGMYVKSNGVYQDYCDTQSPRIVVFNFKDPYIAVSFTNVEEVRMALQPLSKVPVNVVVFNKQSPLADLIKAYDEADIIVTPSGPHLAQGLFIPLPYKKAIVEVTPFMLNAYYYHQYRRTLGFAEYVLSTGHATGYFGVNKDACVIKRLKDFAGLQCNMSHQSFRKFTQDRFVCPKSGTIFRVCCNTSDRSAN